jgi:hypothetical protein
VAKEVKNGLISVERAREDYGVVVVPESCELDPAGTKNLREMGKG